MDKSDGTKLAEENTLRDDGIKEYLEPRFECPICLTWLHDPVLTSCGHKFCSQCIYTWLEKEGACCPVDSKPLKSESDLFRDLYTSREISQQVTPCPYQQLGCEVKLSPVDMEAHINQCAYKRYLPESQNVHCLFKNVGCLEIFQTEENLQTHLNKNTNMHLTLILKALPQLCQSNASAIAAESKLWDAPPKNTTSSEKNEPSLEWQQLLKNLYERIVVLEQQIKELSITVSNQKTKLTTLQTSLRFNQEEMFLRNCNGIYIWKLNDFEEKLVNMTNDPLKMFYSPGFYTNLNGYKMCARINVSSKDPEFLSLLLHIMKSENDDGLDWPFNGTMYFVLVHPYNREKDIREITSSRPDLEAFRKPVCELNKRSFGYTEFVRIRDLPDFLQNDCLTFRVENEDKMCNGKKMPKWRDVSLADVKKFLGLIILMGQVKKDRKDDYWSSEFYTKTPSFSTVMLRNRFRQIWDTWHFSNNRTTAGLCRRSDFKYLRYQRTMC